MNERGKTNTELLIERFSKIPRLDETGPKKGYNGELMTKRGRRWRLLHAAMCVIGFIPVLLHIFGVPVSPRLAAAAFGLIVPGGGFMACGGLITMAVGLFCTFYLWRRIGMLILDKHGSSAGLFGFWLIGVLGGLLASEYRYWGFALALAAAAVLFGSFEVRVGRIYRQMKLARAEREAVFDEAVADLEKIMSAAPDDSPRELDGEQLAAVRCILQASVRKTGDFSGFDNFKRPMLTDNRYQFSVVGMVLFLLHGKYLPNFRGYLTQAWRFCIDAVTDPRTCGYWKKTNLLGYWKWDPDPIKRANIMLSGWMLPMIAGYGASTGDRRYENEGALKFRPFADKPERSFDYSAKGCVEALYRQYLGHEFPYMLIPCEPHVEFPTCNSYGLLGMLIYDRDHGTHYCDDIWDELYKNFSSEFVETEGTIAIRRQDVFGLRHIPASQMGMGYDPMGDVQNYLHYSLIFPGIAKRGYAFVRRNMELRGGIAYIKGKKWNEVFDLATMSYNPALVIAMLEITAAEYGDTELVAGLRRAEEVFLERSKDPNVLKYKGVPLVVTAFLTFARLLRKGDWYDLVLRGVDERAITGPVLTDCAFPDVMVARACSSGDDLDLVLYNGAGSGAQSIKIEQLTPGTPYLVEQTGERFTADENGCAELSVYLDGRTPVHIVKAL